MISLLITPYASGVMIFLADSALRSIILACLAALALAGLRVRQVTVHLAVWTGVLYAALAMPLLSWMTPAISLRVPVQLVAAGTRSANSGQISGPEQTAAAEREQRSARCPSLEPTGNQAGAALARGQSVVDGRLSDPGGSVRSGEAPRLTTGALTAPQVGGQEGAAGRLPQLAPKLTLEMRSALARLTRVAAPARILTIYILGLTFLLGHLITGIFLGRRLRRSFTRVDDLRALQWVERGAAAMGLKRAPRLAESQAVSVPLMVGVFHPVIVIPSGWREWPSAKLAAVIAHEVSHVRRKDALTRVAALVYQCLFWFSPLGWWLEPRLAELAEQASDEAAIRTGAEPTEYATILLSFFDSSTRQGRVSWHGVSMARGGRARKRIDKVLAADGALPAAIKTRILVLLGLCALPVVWLTAATRPVLVDSVASKPLTQNVARTQFLPAVPAGPKISPLVPDAASNLPLLASTAPLKGSSFPDDKTGKQQTRPQAAISGDSTEFYPWLKSLDGFGNNIILKFVDTTMTGEDRKHFLEHFGETQAVLRQEMETPYRKWLSEEVPYIITDRERAAFKKLAADDEREAFIENFWERRNPKPGSPENEFKEEYYRRIAYANEHYASGIPGWKTDRGRIYIMYGPPDEIDSHRSGGPFKRPDSEGGGVTYTFPFERWRYRYIDGIGTNIVLEFVDADRDGEYHLTMDPAEKDALLHVPGVPAQGRLTPAPPLAPFRPEDQAITMCILLDNSRSMRHKRAGVMAARLVLEKASEPQDNVYSLDFNEPGTIQSGGGSAIWDVMWMSIDRVEQWARYDRKVLVMVTDGNDTSSTVTQHELLGKLKNSHVRVYCIGLLSEDDNPRQAEAARLVLGQLAAASGGLAYYPKNLAEVKSISREIADEVRK